MSNSNSEYREEVKQVAKAFIKLGLKHFHR